MYRHISFLLIHRYIDTFVTGPSNHTVLFLFGRFFLYCRITKINLSVFKFLSGNQYRFRYALIKFRNLDLLPILKNFFQIIRIRSKFLQFTAQLLFHLHGNLIGSFGNNGYRFINVIIGFCSQNGRITGNGVIRRLYFFKIYQIDFLFSTNLRIYNLSDISRYLRIFSSFPKQNDYWDTRP